MSTEQARLIALIAFVKETARLLGKVAVSVPKEPFARFEHELAGLPGIRLNVEAGADEEDVWLSVDRLQETSPPVAASPILRPWIALSERALTPPTLRDAVRGEALIAAGTHVAAGTKADSERGAQRPEVEPEADVALADYPYVFEVRAQFEAYLESKWRPWSVSEEPRLQAIRLYAQLFTLHQQLEGGLVDAPLELVWGIGIGVWNHQGARVQYPLLTAPVELALDKRSARIEVRPRDVDPRLEIDWYASVRNPGVPSLETAAKAFLGGNDTSLSPFNRGSFEPLLRTAATTLDANGSYWPDHTTATERTLPPGGDKLKVTDSWVLFARSRTQNVFLQDLDRLNESVERAEGRDALPGAVAAVVTDPSADNPVMEFPGYRGVSACGPNASPSAGKARDLYFPKPFNDEQVRIVQMLDVSDGVVVQGPPGTGKTHTIANVICHYLAAGKRVLVTSMKDPALAVLRDQLPEEIRSLAISLLSSEQAGMKQFEHAIQKIATEVQGIDRVATRRHIERLEDEIDGMHAHLAQVDRAIADWATKNLSKVEIDGETVAPVDAALQVIAADAELGWFPDALGISPEFAPQVTDAEMAALRAAREALGQDMAYLDASLPEIAAFPTVSELVEGHANLLQLERLEAEIAGGAVPDLSEQSERAYLGAATLAAKAERLVTSREELRKAQWLEHLREPLAEETIAQRLDALGNEIAEAFAQRDRYLARPVQTPPACALDDEILSATENLAYGQSAFGVAGWFGKSQQRASLAAIRVLGVAPKDAADWDHVNGHLRLVRKMRGLVVQWNALAGALALPSVEEGDANAAAGVKRYHALAVTSRDCLAVAREVRAEAMAAFATWPLAPRSGDDDAALGELRRILAHHGARRRLSNAHAVRDRFQAGLQQRSGEIVGKMRHFLDRRLGDPQAGEDDIRSEWNRLIAELSRVLSLRSELGRVRHVTERLAASGAPRYAALLREPRCGVVDQLIPDNWRAIWRLRRLRTRLEEIDPGDKPRELARSRSQTEGRLARSYEELIVRRTWLELADKATNTVRAALQAYLNAVKRIGRGTGKRVPYLRQEARLAAAQASSAVPCWIMPHYRISESLPPELGCFHLVVIDEASQSDLTALPALLRAKKVLVVGDDKQVSPEGVGLEVESIQNLMKRFLSSQVDLFKPQMDPSRSIYDLFKVVFAANQVMLREHFRCVAPIIEYSKREFYNHELRPLRLPKASERLDPPLIDVLVRDGYRKGDLNRPEARFIVEEIKRIADDPTVGNRSIGVVSLLGEKQALHIWERLTQELGPDVMRRHRIACGDARTFQGNERDIMFLTMVKSRGDGGVALARATFEQRFNVAASRARDRMYLVRSVSLDDLSPADRLRRSLIAHFDGPFENDPARVEDLRKLCESDFEREVYDELAGRGYRVTPQVRVGQYRIDLVVEGANDARLAIECDGDRYHGADRWVDDMRRQRDLERAGWTFWRSFAATFVRRRTETIADLLRTLAAHGIDPIGAAHGTLSIHSEHRVVSAMADAAGDEPDSGPDDLPGPESDPPPPTAPDTGGRRGLEESGDQDALWPLHPSVSVAERNDHAELVRYCRDKALKLVDNRSRNGALWVIHMSADDAIATRLKQFGLKFKVQKGWWTK